MEMTKWPLTGLHNTISKSSFLKLIEIFGEGVVQLIFMLLVWRRHLIWTSNQNWWREACRPAKGQPVFTLHSAKQTSAGRQPLSRRILVRFVWSPNTELHLWHAAETSAGRPTDNKMCHGDVCLAHMDILFWPCHFADTEMYEFGLCSVCAFDSTAELFQTASKKYKFPVRLCSSGPK